MKKYVLILVLMLLGATGTYAQNSLLQTIATPAGTAGGGNYRAGDVFSITYTANFSLIDGAQTQIDVVYDADILQLTNPSIIASSGVFNLPTTVPISGATIAKRYQTDPYTASYSFLGATTFTLTFRVKSVLCGIPAQNIKVELSTLNPPPTVTNLQVVTTTITIDNTAADASVVVDLINGSSCMGTALYRITTVGRIDAPQDKLYLSMPAGATVSAVYNSGGAEVTAVSTVPILIFYSPLVATLASGGHDHWTYWDRDPTSELQVHYVMVNFAGGMCGGTISVNFVNSRLCFLEDAIVATPMNLAPCPCPSVDPGTGVISVGDSVGNGVVIVSKTFSTSNPLQYFCGANNCREHQYIVTVSNVSPLNLNNFELRDYLASLNISAGAGAIMVTGMAVSLTPFGPATAAEVFDFVPTPTTASVLISPGITADGIYHNIYTPDPINGIWPPATNATWNISGGALGLTVLPAYTTVRLRISHRLNDCPSPLADPLVNTAGVNFSAGSSSYSRTVSNTRTVNDAAVPVITAAKAVRKDGAVNYASSITAAPGETVEFKITIRNYGMAPGSVIVNDVLFNPSATCSDLMAMGMYPDLSTFKVEDNTTDASGAAVSVYSTTALDAIRTALGSLGTTGFTSTPIVIEAASSCSAISELVISYKAILPTDPCCGFQNRNSVTLTDPGSGATIDQTRTAIVTADRFKYIELKLEATCNPADDSSWVSTIIDARPGQNIYYRASIRNNNNYPLSNLRMMVQLPSGDAGATNVSTHNSDPIVTLTSGASPAGYGFWGTGPVGIVSSVPAVPVPFYQPTLEDNWLSTTPLSPTPTGKAIYATGIGLTGSVGGVPGEEYVIRYTIVTPVVAAGSSFNTAMGVGLAAGTECPFVASTNLLLNIVDSNACDTGALWCDCTITGDSSICVGCMGTTLYGCDSGTWSTDCTSVATVGSSSGVVSGHAAGTAIITYTSPDGCISVIVITVNPVPTMCSATVCSICSGTLFSYNPTSTTPGATFEWNRPMVPGISNPAASGTGNPNEVLINTTTSPVVVAYVYTVTANGCSSTQTVNVTVIPGVANTYTVTGGGNYCAGAPCPSIGLSGSDPGVSYQLYCGSTATGAPVVGSGGPLSLGSYCGPCVYSVLATNTATSCTLPMTGTVTVNEYPACPITGTNVICVGNMTNLSSSCAGGIWSSSMPGVGSVNPLTGQVIGISEGVTTIAYTSVNGCISTYSVTVNSFPATPVISGGPLFVCPGGTAMFTASPTPGTWMLFGPTYGTLAPTNPYFGNSANFTAGIFVGVQQIYYMYSNNCGTSMANINVTVGVLPPITGPDTICKGSMITLSDEISGGGWSSTDGLVATAGTNGVITAHSLGSATISYALSSGCYATKVVWVVDCPCNYMCDNGDFEFPAGTGSNHVSGATLAPCWYTTEPDNTMELWGNLTAEPAASGIQFCEFNSSVPYTTIYTDFTAPAGSTVTIRFAHKGRYTLPDTMAVYMEQSVSGGFTAPSYPGAPTGATQIGLPRYADNYWGGWKYYTITQTLPNTPGPTRLYFYSVATGIPNIEGGNFLDDVSITLAIAPITGPSTLCVGASVTEANADPCGLWSSSDQDVASVGSLSGIVTGNQAGTANITFTNCSGCVTVKTVTVLGACPITGSTSICMGTPAVLSACDSGTWYNGGSPCVSVSGGVVTGLSAPCTATITYMSTNGCISTTTVSVSVCDSPCVCVITGDSVICVGATSPLMSNCDSGIWSSSNVAIASVHPFTGLIGGISEGTAVITYISPTGCISTFTVTVLAPTVVVIGTTTTLICVGGSTTFTSTSSGGFWSSANTGVAIVGSGTGLVFGTGVGTTVITYIYYSPCGTIYTTVNVTVESTVGVINGPDVLCVGSDITLSDTTICGDWSSSDDAVATVTNTDGTSQTVHGVSAGVVHITFTNCSGCYTVKTITVNEACAITGSTSICMGTPAVLSACDSGTWYNGGSPCVSVSGGMVTGLSAPCTATITYMSTSGCISTTTVSVTDCDSTECGCTLTGDVTLCVGDYSLISGCDSGFWSSGDPAVASVNFLGGVTGNSAGVAVISHISPTGCVTTINVMVYAPPTVCVLTGGGSMCEGECHSIALTCSDMGVNYQLYLGTTATGGVQAGTGFALSFGAQCVAGTYYVMATNPVTGCTSTSNTVSITTCDPCPPCPISGSTVVCVGQASTYTTLCPGGTWSGSDDSLASIGIATGILTAHSAGTYVVTYSTPSGCTYTYTVTISTLPVISGPYSICVGSTVDMGDDTCMMWSSSNSSVASVSAATGVVGGLAAGNATITVTSCYGCFSTQVVTINPQPSPVIVSGGGTYCGSATIVASAGYGGTIYFQGTTSGGTSTSTPATSVTVTTPGTYYFRSRSASGCWGQQGSAVVLINPLPTVCTLTGGGTVCDSACPEITLTCSNSGVSYQLYLGTTGTGAMLPGTGSALSFGGQCMAGTYSVMATNSITGCTNASNTVVITSCTACPPCPISGPVTMCVGDSYTYTDECPGGTWSVSNSSIGVINVFSGIFNSTGGGVQTITYKVGSCINVHVVTINPVPAAVTVSGGGTFCGSADIFAMGGTGGMIYFQGTTSMGTSTATPTTTMNVTASGTYYFRAMAASGCWGAQGSVVVTINDLPAPVSVTGGGAFCTSATLLATNGGSGTIYYQGTTSGGTSPVNAINPQTVSASGMYYFRARAGNGCWGIEGSAAVTINPTPAAVTATGAGIFCGSTVIAASGGAGGTIYFQGTSSGGTSTATPSASESVSASGTYYFRSMSASGCWGPQGSVTVTINPGPDAVSVSGGGTYCGSAVITATGGTGGNIYFQGTTSGGTSTSTGTLTSTKTVTTSGTYYFRSRSASGCWGAEGSVTVVINPLPGTVSVTGGGSSCGSATLNASGGSGGMIYFQGLTSGGTLTDNPGSSFTVATTGMYYFRALSADGCWGPEAGSSVTISALPTAVTVTGGGAGCGSSTLLATNGGSGNIYYQGTTSGGTSAATPATSIVVSTSGTYYFRARLGTCWGPEGSATVSVSSAPSAVTVSGGGTYCGSATLTAAGGAGGTIYFQGTTSGGTATDNPGATQAVTATGTYYFRSMSAGGCWGPEGSTVVVVTPAPGAVTVTGGGTYCGSAVLTASNDGVGLIFWEGTTNNGMYATTQTTTQTVSASGTYYFRAKSGACWSAQGSATVTIKPLPSAITGSLGLCVSGSTDLNCSSAGSGWSSDNTAIATVSAAGLVRSVAGAGTATISYTGTNGCARTVDVTVSVLNPNAGVPVICMGSTPSSIAILTNDAPGGVWSSLHPTKALISGSSGAIKGVGLGTATIVYTLGSCSTSTTVTVNGAVAAINGLSSVHQSMSIPLSCTTPLGAWSSSNGNAIVDPGSGIVTGVNTGGATISYIVNPGCYRTKDITVLAGRPEMPEESAGVAVEFAVYPNPSAGNIVLSSPVTGNMTIYTMDGKVVQQFVITESVTPLTLPQGLAAGIYMCRFAGSDGVVKMVKLVYEP